MGPSSPTTPSQSPLTTPSLSPPTTSSSSATTPIPSPPTSPSQGALTTPSLSPSTTSSSSATTPIPSPPTTPSQGALTTPSLSPPTTSSSSATTPIPSPPTTPSQSPLTTPSLSPPTTSSSSAATPIPSPPTTPSQSPLTTPSPSPLTTPSLSPPTTSTSSTTTPIPSPPTTQSPSPLTTPSPSPLTTPSPSPPTMSSPVPQTTPSQSPPTTSSTTVSSTSSTHPPATPTPSPTTTSPSTTTTTTPSPPSTPSPTTASTQTTTTATPSPTGPTKPPRILDGALYCTASVGMVAMVLPPDGVCDYMFFDSLYTENNPTLIDQAPSGQLAEYLTAASSSQKTEHGVGINVRFVDAASNHLKNSVPQSKSFLGTLLSRKVVGFGVLSINKLQFSSDVYKGAVSLLLAVKSFVSKELGRNDIFTVIGIYITAQETQNALIITLQSIGAPDVFIGLGHIAFANNNRSDCQMIPFSMFDNDTKANEMRAKYGSLYLFACDGVNLSTWKLNDPFPYLPAIDSTSVLIANSVTSRYYIYDNDNTLAHKFCVSKLILWEMNIGLAAYDVNYDHGTSADPSSLCDPKITKVGNFSRLYVIRKLKDIFLKHDNHTKKLDNCVNEALG
ncbi:uncharacterized protein LOC142766937 isoform X2 [Rhipicephalus microplus]|uniref:uncharacterized protein LOC142766937 isoform X2 n=1 Tax=Rhipicephalus microplus TaxID=6941 RepID=UPI003F6C95BF